MPATRTLWYLLPRQLRRFPADLSVVVVLVGLGTVTALAPAVRGSVLGVLLGVPLVGFLPGYSVVATLFPGRKGDPEDRGAEFRPRMGPGRLEGNVSGLERVVLSFFLSIGLTILLGVLLSFTPWGIRRVPLLVTIDCVTLAMTAVAVFWRWNLPPDQRFHISFRDWYDQGRSWLASSDSRTDAVLTGLLVVSILFAFGSVAYASGVSTDGEEFTEFYIVNDDSSGQSGAVDYPTNLTVGERESLSVGIGNHEGERKRYTVIVRLQMGDSVDGQFNVSQQRRLGAFEVEVPPGERRLHNHSVEPSFAGVRFRIQYLLYKDGIPENPSARNAYRDVHLWVNVSAPE